MQGTSRHRAGFIVPRLDRGTCLVAKGGQRLELAKVETDRDRLLQELREPERQHRQGTYHRFLALDRYDMALHTGVAIADDAAFAEANAEFDFPSGGIHLFGAQGSGTR